MSEIKYGGGRGGGKMETQLTTLTAEIDKLKEEKEKLLEVLRPFAKALRQLEDEMQLSDDELRLMYAGTGIQSSDLRAAAALIKELEGEE